MSNDFLSALTAEIETLVAELEADPRQQKLRELRRVEALYNGHPVPAIRQRIRPVAAAASTPPRRSPSPERLAILDQAKKFIAGRHHPTPTAEIYETLALMMEIPGKDPKNNLSAMLSNSPEFVSHRRAGWTLASESPAKTPEATGDLLTRSAPAASMSSPASPAGEPHSVRPVDPAPGGGT